MCWKFFMFLFATCMYFLMKYLFTSFAHCFLYWVVSLLLSLESSLYIQDSATLLDVCCSFSSFTRSAVWRTEVFSFDEVQLIHLLFYRSCFWYWLKTSLPNQRPQRLSSVVFHKFYTFRSVVCFEIKFEYSMSYGSKFIFSFCVLKIQYFQHLFFDGTIFPLLNCLCIFVIKSVVHKCIGIVFCWNACLSWCQYHTVLIIVPL